MKTPKNLSLLLHVLAVAAVAAAMVRHFHIKSFNEVLPGVLYTSGQPRGMDYTRLLYRWHIATIVNIRRVSEHREDNWYHEEIGWVRENGVRYFEMPIDKHDYLPEEETIGRFSALMADQANLPVLLHDSNGKRRVALLAAAWLVKDRRWDPAEALRLVDKIKDKGPADRERLFLESLAR